MIKYNEKQKEIINEPLDKNILVSASAGSGKTSILVERILTLITENNDISLKNMVIMTFTKKATSEMKKKLKEGIELRLKNDPDNKKLITESAFIESANIMTIDSFCKKILEENYENLSEENSLYSNFDISYRVADEKELNILYNDVLDDLLEKKYGENEYRQLFDAYIEKCDESYIKDMLLRGLFFLSSIPFADIYLKERIENFDKESIDAHRQYIEKKVASIKELSNDISSIDDLFEVMNEASDNLAEANKTDKKTYKDVCIIKDEFLPKLIDLLNMVKNLSLDEKSILEIEDTYIKIKKPSFPRKDLIMVADQDAYINAKNGVLKIYDDLSIISVIKETLSLPKEIICNENERLLLTLLKEFYEEVINEKKRKNVIAISDYAMLSLDILYDKINDGSKINYQMSQLAKELSIRYKAIFVDEYQDTNYIQELILSAITDSFKKNNVFMVGDVKQSIYGFRNAEPKIFAEKFDLYKENNGGKLITLDTNYRSNNSILMFVNHIFSNIMHKDYGDVDYKNDGAFNIQKEAIRDKSVEIDLLSKSEDIIEDDEVKNIEYEAEYVAKKIYDLVSSGKYRYKDIVVLLRSTKGKAEYFIDAFTRYNIPSYSELNKGFFNRFEVKLLISILKVIDNPLQNVPLASVLTSEIFDIKNKELALLKIIYQEAIVFGKGEKFMLYDAIKYFYENHERINKDYDNLTIDINELVYKIDRFVNLFDEFRFKARYLGISELINLVYEKTDAKAIVRKMIDGKMRVANLDILYKNARAYENSSFVGLFNFLRYIEKILSREDDQGQAKLLDEEDNVVRIMTIHTSKGLQFPVVFLCDIDKSYNYEDSKANFYYDKTFGVCLEYIDAKERYAYKTPKLKLAREMSKDKVNQEEMRMFYVALTRAKEKIYMTCFADGGSDKSKLIDVKNAKSYLDLINIGLIDKDLCDIKEEVIENIETNPVVIEKKQKVKDSVEEYVYKYDYLSKISPKFSVSAIKESTHNVAINVSIYEDESIADDINENQIRINGAELGSAYHRYMQYYDYEKSEGPADLLEIIDKDKINDFLLSDIGKRMKEAYCKKKLYREHKFMKLFSQNDINAYLNKDGLKSNEKNVIIQGIIDAFLIEKDGDNEYIVLVDYKTDRIKQKNIDKDSMKKYLIDNYKIQLDIYAKVLSDLLGMKVKETYIYSFAIGEAIKV